MKQQSEKIKKINLLFRRASVARGTMIKEKSLWEEFYYDDVESTLSQYSEDQLEQIRKTFNIPVSTKAIFPVIEQLLAFLTASKPEPKLIAPNESLKEFSKYSQQGFQGIWYESKANRELKDALRDKLNVGSGWLHVRENDFYNESTFNVVIERIDWKKVFVDPEAEKMDLSDADYVFIAEVLRVDRAEKKFDIKIRKKDTQDSNLAFYTEVGDLFNSVYLDYFSLPFSDEAKNEKEKFVLIRTGYFREETNVYVSDEGDISLKRPKTIEIINPERIALQEQIEQVEEMLAKLEQQTVAASTSSENEQAKYDSSLLEDEEANENNLQNSQVMQGHAQDAANDYSKLVEEYKDLKKQYGSLPLHVPAFEMDLGLKDENGNPQPKVVLHVERIRKKIFKKTVLVGDTVVDEKVLPSSVSYYPLIHLGFLKMGQTYKTMGIVHQIMDIVQAMNKTISLTLLDMSINANRKVLYWRGTVVEPSQVESSFAQPGSWTEMIPDPSLPNAGQPTVIEPSPLNQSFMYLLSEFTALIESITGMSGIMKGMQPNIQSQSPQGNGSIALQENELGTSRAKLYGRDLEEELEILSHVVISYLHAYAPKEKELLFFDGEGKEQFLSLPNINEDLQFKVRVDIVSSMPTIRNLAADALGKIAQTAGDPTVASMLVQYYLRLIDLPQSDEWIQQLDMVKNYEQQVGQLQEEIKKKDSDLRNMENNLVQTRIAKEVAEKKHKADVSVAAEEAKAKTDIQNEAQQVTEAPEEEEISLPEF